MPTASLKDMNSVWRKKEGNFTHYNKLTSIHTIKHFIGIQNKRQNNDENDNKVSRE